MTGSIPKRYNIAKVIAENREQHPDIEIEGVDGRIFTVPAPEMWPDEVHVAASKNDLIALATAMLGGEEVYAEFRAAGGSAAVLNAVVMEHTGGVTPGESAAS
jgi:hypothetical protein